MRHTVTMSPDSLWGLPQIRAVCLMAFAGISSFAVMLAALPVWGVGHAVPAHLAGTITTVMLAATVLTQVVSPALMRRFSLRGLLVWGLVLLGLPAPLYLWATALPGLYAVSAVRGVGFGLLTVTAALAIQVAAPPGRQGEAIGLFGLAGAIPTMIGAAIGAGLTLSGNFGWVCVIAATPLLGLAAARGVTADGTAPGGAGESLPMRIALRRLVVPVVLLFAATAAGGAVITVVPLELTGSARAALVLLVFGAVTAYARWRIGRFTDRRGHRLVPQTLTVIGAAGMAVAGWGFAAASVPLLLAGAIGTGIAYGALQSVTLDLAFSRVPAGQAPIASATWNAFFDAGTATGAAVFAAVAAGSAGGAGSMLVGTGLFLLVGLATVRSALAPWLERRRGPGRMEP
ncbi:MFS transporter [Pseudactinotalea sp. HY158]|nr:MFS transporter [Pseudactinotalea sp. HY158]